MRKGVISPSLLYFSTHLIKLLGEHLNILQTSSCDLSSTKYNIQQHLFYNLRSYVS